MLSKNILLGRKTKRNDTSEDSLDQKDSTIIKFINLSTKKNKYKSFCYSYIKFSFTDRYNFNDLIINQQQSIELNIKSDKIFFFDKIELGNDKGKKIHFILPIYKNKINTVYIDLCNKKKAYCFEYIFYAKTIKKLPDYLIYNDELMLKQFDTYNLKYRKRLILLNVEEDSIKGYIKNNSLDSNSYKICIRINNKGKINSSIHEITIEKKKTIKKSKLKSNKKHINDIINLFDEFKRNKSMEPLKEKYNYLDDDKAIIRFLKNYEYFESSYIDIPDINNNDVDLLKEYLLKLILKYCFIEIDKSKNEYEIEDINDNILTSINNITNIIDDIEQFTEGKQNSEILRFRLFRSTLYNLYSSISKKSSNKLACLTTISQYHQKIIDINACSKNNPYYKAIVFLKEVADNLNEDSALFDLLMQYNSGISDDVNLINEQNKPVENNSKYEISMLTVSEVATHLKNILPEFMIRYTCDNKVDSFYSTLNDLIFINEKKTFQRNDISHLDGLERYTLPIVILLLHESWGHRKVAKSNDIEKDSPIRNYLRIENFNEELNEIIIDETGNKKKGESGLEIEFLLTGDNKSSIFREFLSDCVNDKNINLLNIKFWVKKDFKEFQKVMIENYKQIYDNDINKIKRKNREDEMDNDFSIYQENVFYIDGVKKGPFCKV